MIVPIPSKKKSFRLKARVSVFIEGRNGEADPPFLLSVSGHDPSRPNTYYFRRCIPFLAEDFDQSGQATRDFSIPLPLSPDLLILELRNKCSGDKGGFKLEKLEAQTMEPTEVWAEPEVHRFIPFAQDFAIKAGYTEPGYYDSADQEFLIQYLPRLIDEYGAELVTPARTRRATGRIQASRKHLMKYTIPVRFFVLLHEHFHFQIPTREEKPADYGAARIYLDLGFPRIEAVYALTQIFQAHPDSIGEKHLVRVRDMMAYIDNYAYAKEQQKIKGAAE